MKRNERMISFSVFVDYSFVGCLSIELAGVFGANETQFPDASALTNVQTWKSHFIIVGWGVLNLPTWLDRQIGR